ncbi:uncharacterized protein LOC129606213 [Condylostylus longicornis]|uniref:uncharacterized protein LOC129606213 n=1 Tax=Condylostylus longicornis TaxID=2530218 RepID=UPI00244E02B5|nr:uncharacterized protein LOC129606213 [Condylostylus longicornis]
MSPVPFQIWNANRSLKIVVLSMPTIKDVIEKAKNRGIIGSQLVLESSGSKIMDDELLEYYSKNQNQIFILLDDEEEWVPDLNLSAILSGKDYESSQKINSSILKDLEILPALENAEPNNLIETQINKKSSYYSNLAAVYIPIASTSSYAFVNESQESVSNTETLSMSSGVLSSSSSTNSQCTKLLENFKIPWNKMPFDVIDMLKLKQNIGKRINSVANIIVDELRSKTFFIPMKIFRMVAHQAVSEYPDSFLQFDVDKQVVSSSPIALVETMRNRNNFLNRPPRKSNSETGTPVHIKNRKTTNILKGSVKNWQPKNKLSEEVKLTLDGKKQYLQQVYGREHNSEEKKIILQYMKDCFPFQRLYFNSIDKVPSVRDVKENWPFIFEKSCLFQHFTELTNLNPEHFKKQFSSEKPILYEHFMQNKTIKSFFANEINDEKIICAVIMHFKEDQNLFYKKFELGTTLDEIIEASPTSGPWIAIVDISVEKKMGYISLEKSPVAFHENPEILDLLIEIIAVFYVFNIMYSKSMSQSYEFFVRFFYKYYPEEIRGKKKNISNMCKINNLIKRLDELRSNTT